MKKERKRTLLGIPVVNLSSHKSHRRFRIKRTKTGWVWEKIDA